MRKAHVSRPKEADVPRPVLLYRHELLCGTWNNVNYIASSAQFDQIAADGRAANAERVNGATTHRQVIEFSRCRLPLLNRRSSIPLDYGPPLGGQIIGVEPSEPRR